MMKRKKALLSMIAMFLMLCLFVGGITGCSSKQMTATDMVAETITETGAAMEAAYVTWDINGSEDKAGGSGGLTSTSASTTSPPQVDSGRKLIRQVEMNVETTTFDQLMDDLNATINSLSGYVEESHINGVSIQNHYSDTRSASVIIRIPGQLLDQLIQQVESQGNVIRKSERTSDVTLQYADIESRKKSLTIEQDRVWSLLEKADDIEVILSLETHLSDLRYQLETMESQLRLFDNQVSYSTITLYIEEVTAYTTATTAQDGIGTRIQTGFSSNLRKVVDALTNLLVTLISGLPVFAILALVIFAGLKVYRRHQKSKQKEQDQALAKEENKQ